MKYIKDSYYEKTARERVHALADAGSFDELLPAGSLATSPHLADLGIPGSFDDGVIIGRAKLDNKPIHIIAQEGQFIGGSVGEIHGAKIVGLLLKAIQEQSGAVLLLVDSGGVRLHEANAGLIAISEIMRAMLKVRKAGIPIITVIGGLCGAFGGMGIASCLSSYIIMSEEGRLALSGPEVIETVKGIEEFDAKDRALVWRVTGGKHRYLLGEIEDLVEDDITAMRQSIERFINQSHDIFDLPSIIKEHTKRQVQFEKWFGHKDGKDIWRMMGMTNADEIAMMDSTQLKALIKEFNHA